MENINAVVVVRNNIIEVEDFTVKEMTHEDYIRCINRLKNEMAQLQSQYDTLVKLTNVIQRQRDKYIMKKLNSSCSYGIFTRR